MYTVSPGQQVGQLLHVLCGGCHQVGALGRLTAPVEREAEPMKLLRVGERALHRLWPETV